MAYHLQNVLNQFLEVLDADTVPLLWLEDRVSEHGVLHRVHHIYSTGVRVVLLPNLKPPASPCE